MATVQGRSGSRWISEIARPICGSCSALSHPVWAPGSVSIQERIACIDEDVRETRDHRLAPRPELSGLGGHQPSVLCIQSSCGEPDASTWIVSGRSREVARRRVVEAHRAADQQVGAPPPPWRRIS